MRKGLYYLEAFNELFIVHSDTFFEFQHFYLDDMASMGNHVGIFIGEYSENETHTQAQSEQYSETDRDPSFPKSGAV